jgi:uroporphyrinogen III methyltransferase/synthase
MAPTIRIAPPDDPEPLRRAAADLSRFDWIIFTSANVVDALYDAAQATGTAPAPVKVCAVGTRTADRIRERGVEVTMVPAEFRAEALVAALLSTSALAGTRVLLPRADIGRTVLGERLRAAGAVVTEVIAYRTVAETRAAGAPDVLGGLAAGQLDAVTFTSGSAVRNFVQIYGSDSAALLRSAVVAAIGPVTADTARELGIAVDVQPKTYTAAAMVEELARYFAAQAK